MLYIVMIIWHFSAHTLLTNKVVCKEVYLSIMQKLKQAFVLAVLILV